MRYRTFLQFVEKLYKTGCLGGGRENPTRVPAPKASSESKPECLSPSPRQPVLLQVSGTAAAGRRLGFRLAGNRNPWQGRGPASEPWPLSGMVSESLTSDCWVGCQTSENYIFL